MTMTTFTLTVETDNAAFGDCDAERRSELALVLRRTADGMEAGAITASTIRDDNGNTVGRFDWTDAPADRDPLTIADAVTLADVIRWCQENARLAWVDDRGDIAYGTARSIGDHYGAFLAGTRDVRDAFVRITTEDGWEWFPRMTDVMARHQAGTMLRDFA
jgi:hypothetical protein